MVQVDHEEVFQMFLKSSFYSKEGRYAPHLQLEAVSIDPEEFDQIPASIGNTCTQLKFNVLALRSIYNVRTC